ncbi:MAG: exostosin family protein, partial [Methyloceanibacter sp.]|nr:exostosin family protein [Methyloceanibacter sp.]
LLFSFVGLVEHQKYLTDVRATILRALSGDNRGLVVGRDSWHYQKIVYEHQVTQRATSPEGLIDDAASTEHISALRNSVFCLCPSGTGPNTIRLWEAIGSGSVPVILSETYDPPGDRCLWDKAAIFCPETAQAIEHLPDRLEKMAQNSAAMAEKRHALKQLWSTYGPDGFVRDIESLCAGESATAGSLKPSVG